jgi:peptidyl-prolyl cis-trans isomerase C
LSTIEIKRDIKVSQRDVQKLSSDIKDRAGARTGRKSWPAVQACFEKETDIIRAAYRALSIFSAHARDHDPGAGQASNNIFISVFAHGWLMVKEVHAAHILCKTEKKALEVKELLAKGSSSFAEMARKYSQCPSGKSGGDLGWFGKGKMVAEFEKAAFEGEKGKILGPVKSQFGYHLIKVLDKK